MASYRKFPLGMRLPLASIIPLVVSVQAYGYDFYVGDVEARFNSQLTIGSSWRMEDADPAFLSPGNADDGNANFDKGDAFSQIFKGVHDLRMDYENFGFLVRGKYWYDTRLIDQDVNHGHTPTATVGNGPTAPFEVVHAGKSRLDDSDFSENSKFSGATLLDAFVYGAFDVADTPVELRLGQQVVSWGESTFIMGGVNTINPFDVSALRRPGAQIKEALIPVNMVYGNIGLSDSISAEAFYQLDFKEAEIAGCGTYFSFNDYAPEGCDIATLGSQNASLQRDEDGIRRPDSSGQFGLALRYFSESLGNTEFGLYYTNLHSRLPVISGIKNDVNEAAIGANFGPAAAMGAIVGSTKYFVEYPEDTQTLGVSFNTSIAGVALSGEVSHKLDSPLQINATQLISTALSGTTQGLSPLGMDSTELDEAITNTPEGGVFPGYRNFDISQAQVTAVKTVDRVLGASQIVAIGEVGYTYIHDLQEGDNTIKFGRSGAFDSPENKEGWVSQDSWGYRARVSAKYLDVISGINLTPTLSWSHDVSGFGPTSSGAFNEGQQSVGVSLKADYLAKYSVAMSHTSYMGGDYSIRKDRDFASLSLGVQF